MNRKDSMHCPDCGELLVRIKLFRRLFASLLHILVASFFLAILGLGSAWLFDVPGCIERQQKETARQEATLQARRKEVLESMPLYWQNKIIALCCMDNYHDRFVAFSREMRETSDKYPLLNGIQIQRFLEIFGTLTDRAYPILMRVMQKRQTEN